MKIRKLSLNDIIKDFLLKPTAAGLGGLAGFLTVILISKYLGLLVGTVRKWDIDISDVALSSLGFLFLFLINFLKSLQKFHSE